MPVCPTHQKEMKQNSRGWYCATKVGDGWCKYKPPAAETSVKQFQPRADSPSPTQFAPEGTSDARQALEFASRVFQGSNDVLGALYAARLGMLFLADPHAPIPEKLQ